MNDYVKKAIWLHSKHNLQPQFATRAGTGTCICNLIHNVTGEYAFRGVGNSESEAFFNAFEKFENAPEKADPSAVVAENADLREQIQAMEQQLESAPPASVQEEPSADPAAAESVDAAPVTPTRKKRRRKKVDSSNPF